MLAMLKKEWMETVRGGRLLNLTVLFVVFGIMNPAIAKLTPLLMEMMAEEMAETGLVVTAVSVDALTSWTQFFKNIPLALLAFIVLHGTILTGEFQSGSLTLILTKGLNRWKVIAAKTLTMVTAWTAGYWLCFAITFGYNAYFWDNDIVEGIGPATVYWWIFGLWTIGLLMLFSVIIDGSNGSMLGTGVTVLIVYILSLIPKISTYLPVKLIGGMAFVNASAEVPTEALTITLFLTAASLAAAIFAMNRK